MGTCTSSKHINDSSPIHSPSVSLNNLPMIEPIKTKAVLYQEDIYHVFDLEYKKSLLL
jgi:hypothetical protein